MARPGLDEQQEDDRLLDRVFSALSDPVRRSILKRLESGPSLVSELAEPFDISLQAVSRHIQVLEDAGLIQKERTGRISRCSLELGPILTAAVWINRYSKYWQDQFNLLAASLTQIESQRPKSAVRVARPSSSRTADPGPGKRARRAAKPSPAARKLRRP